MITVAEAIARTQEEIVPTVHKVSMPVMASNDYVLFEDVYAPIDMPPFRQSAMDGYALCLHDNHTYRLTDEVKAGDDHHPVLKAGDAVRIFTGAPVPDMANAVIMQEKTNAQGDTITVESTVAVEENIRPLGEQVKQGALALAKGTMLTPAGIGYLASLGITEVNVYKKPKIAIVVTGNELVPAGQPLPYGKIYESNAVMLQSALTALGYTDVVIHTVADDYESTCATLQKTISENDVVILSGGISVGDYDFVGKALQELSVTEIFYKVKQKPGKPLFFGKKKDTVIFALPGNPAAALSCFYIYVYPSLQKKSGDIDFSLPRTVGVSTSEFIKRGDRPQFLKAILKNGQVTILEGQNSSMLQTFAIANALVYMPEKTSHIAIGDQVEVIPLPI